MVERICSVGECELDSEVESECQWKVKIKESNLCDWEEEVESKSSLRGYMLVKNDGTERYIRSLL